MDPNLIALVAVALIAVVASLGAAIAQSETLREYGLWGALRRRFSSSYRISRYR